jgi:cytoskeleton protein RodZ
MLRDARERRGISLRQISNVTKISMSVLEALERNDLSHLPGGIFSRAFVRSYAIEVGLEPEKTVQEFIAQFPSDSLTAGRPASGQIEGSETLESDRRTASVFLTLLVASVAVAGLVLYFGVAARRVAPARAEARAAGSVVEPSAGMGGTDRSLSAPDDAGSPRGGSAIGRSAETDGGRGVVQPAVGDRFVVGLTATARCWVAVTVDGRRAIERELQPGERQEVDVRREMVLTAADAGALTMTLDGAAAKPLGRAGETATARLNLTNFRDYLAAP